MTDSLQRLGLIVLAVIAVLLLLLVGWALYLVSSTVDAEGRVGSAEAFGFTALLLALREVVGAIKAVWDHSERAELTAQLASSAPTPSDPVQTTVEG